ncbi:MAG TPA: hypothetical protein VIU82_21965 [Bosea sp. (in: a-proteobacteria)]
MTHAAKLAREEAFTDAIRIADNAIGDEPPEAQSLRIIAALKTMRDAGQATVAGTVRVNYLGRAQDAARRAWTQDHSPNDTGPEREATAGVDTPLGRLRAVAWRRAWKGTARGERIAWAGEYWLNDEPITLAEIKAAGLDRRPTTRNRLKKDDSR